VAANQETRSPAAPASSIENSCCLTSPIGALDWSRLQQRIECPVCRLGSRVLSKVRTINPNAPEQLELRRCVACKHVFINPVPDQDYLIELYQQASEYVVHRGYNGSSASGDSAAKWIFPDFPDTDLTQTRFLEIGAGSGDLLSWVSQRASLAIGVEPGPWRGGPGAVVADLSEIPGCQRFDAIALLDVLEHVADPLLLLRRLTCYADAGCTISCTVPNSQSLAARLLRTRWSMVRPIGHLNYFSSDSLDQAFRNSGWAPIRTAAIRANLDAKCDLGGVLPAILRGRFKWAASQCIFRYVLGRDQWFIQAVRADN